MKAKRFKLIDVGRNKFNGEVQATTMTGLVRAIRKAAGVMSHDLEITDNGTLFAGFHAIGRIEEIKDEPAAPEAAKP